MSGATHSNVTIGTQPLIRGAGADERIWHRSAALRAVPDCELGELIGACNRVWLIAPHPDDEVLGAGGLVARLLHMKRPVTVVAVTDGAASHPRSLRWTPRRLARVRPRESRAALAQLGSGATLLKVGIADGTVAACHAALLDFLAARMRAGDLALATWRHDGHPDHEATGRATRDACLATGAAFLEYPIWMWHWARPDDSLVPWTRAKKLRLSQAEMARKRHAIRQFASQLASDAGQPAILPPHVLVRFARPFEVFFT